jgi:hypothetical protein
LALVLEQIQGRVRLEVIAATILQLSVVLLHLFLHLRELYLLVVEVVEIIFHLDQTGMEQPEVLVVALELLQVQALVAVLVTRLAHLHLREIMVEMKFLLAGVGVAVQALLVETEVHLRVGMVAMEPHQA